LCINQGEWTASCRLYTAQLDAQQCAAAAFGFTRVELRQCETYRAGIVVSAITEKKTDIEESAGADLHTGRIRISIYHRDDSRVKRERNIGAIERSHISDFDCHYSGLIQDHLGCRWRDPHRRRRRSLRGNGHRKQYHADQTPQIPYRPQPIEP